MARFTGLVQCLRRLVWPFGCMLVLFGYISIASPSHGRRLICWQAIMKCQVEPECYYAYGQYQYACGPVIHGDKKSCPSHCISSLVQLNLTKNGPALEDCDCDTDPICRSTKRAIEPCMPRTSTMGCTEARRQCESDSECSSAMRDYLIHCGKLFSGVRCTEGCRNVIADLRMIPKAQLLDTCVCDGTERTICEYIKISMKTLCFDSYDDGSGFSDSEEDPDYYEDFETTPRYSSVGSAGRLVRAQCVLTVVASILVLVPLL